MACVVLRSCVEAADLKLSVSQRGCRLDSSCATRGNVARSNRDQNENQRGRRECHRVSRLDAKQQRAAAHAGDSVPRRARARLPDVPRQGWAQLMQRAFGMDVLAGPRCGGRLRFVALIEGGRRD
jgi:hypothetical protein